MSKTTPTRDAQPIQKIERPTAPAPVKTPVESPLHPNMPDIPGVGEGGQPAGLSLKAIQALILMSVLVVSLITWRVLSSKGKKTDQIDEASADTQPAPVPFQVTSPTSEESSGNGTVATIEELSSAWSSKTFTFINPITRESVPAIIIHLPGAAASRSKAYWAFSLSAPYSTCELEYVTNLGQLASKFGFRASHPMVVSACDGTIYDPLQVASLPDGAWVRGEVVQGGGIRPPVAIDVRVQGSSIFADSIE